MKKLITLLILLLTIPVSSAKKQMINVNPINLAAQLVEQSSLEKMEDMCRYYGLTECAAEDGFDVYSASDGSKLRFKINNNDSIAATTVEVYTKETPKKITTTLEHLDFKKEGDVYKRRVRFEKQITFCTAIYNIHATSVLTFTRQ